MSGLWKLFLVLCLSFGLVFGFIFALSSSTALAKEADPPPDAALEAAPFLSDSQPLALQAAPIPNNVLIDAVGADPSTLDPALSYSTENDQVIMQIYDTLVDFKREKVDELVPKLASSYTISPDGRTYTFTIRNGVKFHNGNALTASDVAYTFQRGILQGGSYTGQWMLTEPIFGVGIYDVCNLLSSSVCDSRSALQAYAATHAAQVMAVCTDLTSKITYDNAAGTVSFRLAAPYGPFLFILRGAWGSIIDREWSIQRGAWDGSCSTWQNYYAATASNSPLRNVTNGTGPFKLGSWTAGEVVLNRNDQYWLHTPLWAGGPFGPAAFETVTQKTVLQEAERVRMLLEGEADLIAGASISVTQRDAATLYHFTSPDGITPTLKNPAGTLKKYTGALSNNATDAFFTYNIVTGGPRNYIGSGTWDGHGIPVNFFDDIHVRKGFNYAFNWDTYNTEVFGGQAVQRTGPIIKPLIGYADSQPKYSYNPVLALSELNQGWGTLVATNGFSLTVAYNTGNTARQKVAEILKTNIEALDPKFHIQVIGLSWNDFLADLRNKRLPIFVTGWMQDYPHPHNWVVPYLVGAYGSRQNLPSGLRNWYQAQINACVALTGDAARLCYEGIQSQTYTDALDIFLLQGMSRSYISAKVQGYYLNPGQASVHYYDLFKSPLPAAAIVDPAAEATLAFSPTVGTTANLFIPAGTVGDEMQIVVTPDVRAYAPVGAYLLTPLTFDLSAYEADGTPIPDPQFNNPITVTIEYGSSLFPPKQEAGLILLWWDGAAWVDAACGPYVRDLVNHILQAPICHFSTFAVGEPNHPIFLPMLQR